MKKVLALVILVSLFMGLAVVPAQARYDREDAGDVGYVLAASTEHDTALVSKPAYIYAVTVWADAANSYVHLYDATAAPADTNKPKVELGEATQYEHKRIEFNPPLQMSSGIYADVTNGSVVVEYR